MFGTGVVVVLMWTAEAEEGWNSKTKAYRMTEKKQVPRNIQSQAEVVVLAQNQFPVIQENTFKHLNVCEHLYLNDNEIKTIETGAFNGLDSLTKLSLSDNEIQVIGHDIFVGLTECTELLLNKNKISTIESGALQGMKSLIWLDLAENLLTTLPWTIFGLGHPAGITLSLSDNPMQCNSTSLCYIKNGEQQGWLKWKKLGNKVYNPECFKATSIHLHSNFLSCSKPLQKTCFSLF